MDLLADLVERLQPRLVRYLLYLTGRRDYAEDLAQETWIRVMQRGSQYNAAQRFDPWLFAIARNLAIDYLRKNRKGVATVSLPNDPDAVLLLPSSDPSPFEAAARRLAADSAAAVSRGFAAEVSRRPVAYGDGSGLGRPYHHGDVQNLSRSCSTEIRIRGG
jgi:RNA polymerase sigma factor (sigma-70 family)